MLFAVVASSYLLWWPWALRAPGPSCPILLQYRVRLNYISYTSVKDEEEAKTILVVS